MNTKNKVEFTVLSVYHKWSIIIFDYNPVASKLMDWIVK